MILIAMSKNRYSKPLMKSIVAENGELLSASEEIIKVVNPDATEELDYEILSKECIRSGMWENE